MVSDRECHLPPSLTTIVFLSYSFEVETEVSLLIRKTVVSFVWQTEETFVLEPIPLFVPLLQPLGLEAISVWTHYSM